MTATKSPWLSPAVVIASMKASAEKSVTPGGCDEDGLEASAPV
jgi:hypothetical protein